MNNKRWELFKLSGRKYKRALAMVLVAAAVVGTGTACSSKSDDPMAGVYEDYEETENEELTALIQAYYQYYADGDVDSLKTVADPVSDMEASYIEFMSQYIEEYQDITLYTKRGADETAYLVSAQIKMKFVDIETPASGLDFFYVKTTEDGNLVIDNVYSAFNQTNGEYEMDETISKMITEFEQQEDVVELQNKVTEELNSEKESDEALNTFVTTTLSDNIITWANEYKANQEAAEAEAKAAEDAAKAAEDAAKAEEEENANAITMFVQQNAAVRETNDDASAQVGTVSGGQEVTVYVIDTGWAKIDFNGTKCYVHSDILGETAPAEAGVDRSANGASYTFNNATNIRTDRSEAASVLAAILPGESVTIIESYADGWTKVNYNGYEGFIRTDMFQ